MVAADMKTTPPFFISAFVAVFASAVSFAFSIGHLQAFGK
jgi:hypothetical protein